MAEEEEKNKVVSKTGEGEKKKDGGKKAKNVMGSLARGLSKLGVKVRRTSLESV